MTHKQLSPEALAAKSFAKEFCKDWPSGEQYHTNDLTLFVENGYLAGHKVGKAERDAELDAVIKYCRPHMQRMWASRIIGILLECDWRDANIAVDKYFGVESE